MTITAAEKIVQAFLRLLTEEEISNLRYHMNRNAEFARPDEAIIDDDCA